MASIALKNVCVEFPIYHLNARSLKKQFLRLTTGGKLLRTANDSINVRALENVSLHLAEGDRLGILGHNGAGKSTLLKVLSRIYEPTAGHLHINGKISPLLDVMVGIDAESTGYENIVMRGILLGLTRKEIEAKIDEIAEFTELGDYLSVPIRTYSTGMRVRLAFGVATSIVPEILIMDEIVGAGDAAFMNKAQERLNQLIYGSKIVILSSHAPDIIEKICNKVLMLEHGKVKFLGDVKEAIKLHTNNSNSVVV